MQPASRRECLEIICAGRVVEIRGLTLYTSSLALSKQKIVSCDTCVPPSLVGHYLQRVSRRKLTQYLDADRNSQYYFIMHLFALVSVDILTDI